MSDLTDEEIRRFENSIGDEMLAEVASRLCSEVRRHRATLAKPIMGFIRELDGLRDMKARLESWAVALDDPHAMTNTGHFIALELRNRMRGDK